MILNKRQVRQLKALASNCSIRYILGKNEISETFLDMVDKGITKHELVKIDLLQTVTSDKYDLADSISSYLHAEVITVIGNVIVLYRKNLNNPVIKLVD